MSPAPPYTLPSLLGTNQPGTGTPSTLPPLVPVTQEMFPGALASPWEHASALTLPVK